MKYLVLDSGMQGMIYYNFETFLTPVFGEVDVLYSLNKTLVEKRV